MLGTVCYVAKHFKFLMQILNDQKKKNIEEPNWKGNYGWV